MLEYGAGVILGKREFLEAIRGLPGRVVLKIMNEWTFRQAQNMAKLARRTAPRDRNRNPNKTPGERLWRSIKASRVRRLFRFPKMISRAIAYGATSGGRGRLGQIARKRAQMRLDRRNKLRVARGMAPQQIGKRARHFHLVVRGTVERVQKSTGRRTGSMWGRTANPRFWEKATLTATANARGEVGAQLRNAYQRGIDQEIKRLARKYK